MLSTDVIDFFYFNVTFPTAINFCVLMAAIPDSASVFAHTIFFFYTLQPFSRLNVGSLLLVYGGTNIYCLKQKVLTIWN